MSKYNHLSEDFTLRGALKELIECFDVYEIVGQLNMILIDVDHNCDALKVPSSVSLEYPPKVDLGRHFVDLSKKRDRDE